jgi:peroxiredoxin
MNMNTQILTPGEPAPDFEITDVNGNLIRLSSFRGKSPVVLAFLRGFM